MRAFTSIEQSKVLAKILPFKSADMSYTAIIEDYTYPQKIKEYKLIIKDECFNPRYDIPAWSLAVLLDVIPHEIKIWDITHYIKIYPKNNNWFVSYKNNNEELVGTYSTFLIDACVEMIVKLKEKGLI